MKRRDVSEADDVFRRSHTKNERTREMFFGQKKNPTQILIFLFRKLLLNQGLASVSQKEVVAEALRGFSLSRHAASPQKRGG